ncbi:hypothetical protein B0H21DRAFT_746094 [Amylocystis lapponica]|nr:hypothetical protein B0H21DRAFT_746094 [Amylocystis lapponica]
MFGFDAFDLFTGIFGIVVWVYAIIERQLPSRKMDSLEEILKRTEAVLQCAVEEGLLEADFVGEARSRLQSVNNRMENLSVRTHAAISMREQYMEVCKGLSCKLSTLHSEAKTIRAEIYLHRAESRRNAEQSVSLPCPVLPAVASPPSEHSEPDAASYVPAGRLTSVVPVMTTDCLRADGQPS